MDFAFPEFVRASNDAAPPAPPQKSLWQLVMESGPNDVIPERFVPRRATAYDAEDHDGKWEAHYGRRDADAEHVAAADATGLAAGTNSTAAGLTSRSSWTPAPYMIQHLMSSGFVSQFAMMHGVECSARLPPPPCLRLQDLQLPPLVLSRLRRNLFLPRATKPSRSDGLQASSRPNLRELQEIVLGVGVVQPPCAEGSGPTSDEAAKGDGDEDGVLRDAAGTLSALQQLAITSMLLGHHTLSVGPRGTGKKTAGFLATGALTLARGLEGGEKGNNNCTDSTNSGGGGGAKVDAVTMGVKQEPAEACMMRPFSPRALILVSSFNEAQRCGRWLQDVFTAAAFAPMTFRRGTADLVPLPALQGRPCGQADAAPQEAGAPPPSWLPPPPPPPPPSPQEQQQTEEAQPHRPREERQEERRELRKRSRDHSRGRHHRRSGRSPAAQERARSRRGRRHRSSSRRTSREGRHRRSRSRDRRRAKRRRSSGRHHRHRSGSTTTSSSSSRSGRHDRKRRRREHSRPRHSHRHDDHHCEDWPHELPQCEARVERLPLPSLERSGAATAPAPAATHDASAAVTPRDEVPRFLQQRLPVLIATHQSLVEALQLVQGQAEVLPLECVRIVCISDADRVAQPTSQTVVPMSWWISLSNAVDVECQYIVSAARMYDEVDGWLQESLLQGTPDAVNRYRQRDDTVWDGVQHILEEVTVDEAEEHAGQHMFERVEAAKLRRLLGLVTRHFRASHVNGVEHSDVADAHHHARGAAATSSAAPFASSVGRMVVVVSSRKEQDAVFPQLLAALRERDARLRCTCQLADFQRGAADVLVAYDWMLCVAGDGGDATPRPVEVVVNFGFPRALMAPGREGSLLECLEIRTRTLLRPTAADAAQASDGTTAAFFAQDAAPARAQPTVVTLLTERQLHGRFGRLLTSRAQALASM
ncbi:uncharacterized protein Tco025E_04230 [Trypanosoma conorhini]|uniref:Uncharacterized protein n=1 Tax=Trypanosoma conorhini TaxID=83891 RepID=A0A3R7L452_9TRYP|nr:uncharacterized protein Tco025E_04230 [Trypanosoma conorhini]RNF19295.1 hypothetical protein Tco025E_04230 [Trypanosoma conorhini]